VTVVEPRQAGRRDFVLMGSEAVARGLFGWRTVPRGHVDVAPLEVLADLLCCGRRSRLWQALVETDGAAGGVEAAAAADQPGGQFFIQVEADGGTDPAALAARIRAELDRLAEPGPTPEELARARRRLEAAWRWEQEDLTGLAAGLGTAALWDDWRSWPAEHRAALAVGAAEGRRVGATYLSDEGLTAGWALPRPGTEAIPGVAAPGEFLGAEAALPGVPSRSSAGAALEARAAGPAERTAAPASLHLAGPSGVARLSNYRPRRSVLAHGLRLVSERRPGTGVV